MLTKFSLQNLDPMDLVLGKPKAKKAEKKHYGPRRAQPPVKEAYEPYKGQLGFATYAATGAKNLPVEKMGGVSNTSPKNLEAAAAPPPDTLSALRAVLQNICTKVSRDEVQDFLMRNWCVKLITRLDAPQMIECLERATDWWARLTKFDGPCWRAQYVYQGSLNVSKLPHPEGILGNKVVFYLRDGGAFVDLRFDIDLKTKRLLIAGKDSHDKHQEFWTYVNSGPTTMLGPFELPRDHEQTKPYMRKLIKWALRQIFFVYSRQQGSDEIEAFVDKMVA